MEPRRIKLNYRTINLDEFSDWLAQNHIKYTFIPYEEDADGNMTIGTLVFFIEVYNAAHETAIRIKWNVER